jgi:sec-independent protein translocase protein TatB
MFDFGIGSAELIVLGVIALIVIGPRDLPKVLRTIGQVMTKVRGLAREFQGHIEDAARDTGLDQVKKDISKATNFSASSILDDKPRTPGKVDKPDAGTAAKPSVEDKVAKAANGANAAASTNTVAPPAAKEAPVASEPAEKKSASKATKSGGNAA